MCVDILAANLVMHPGWFDVVVASNLFGDILSDLSPACTGTIGQHQPGRLVSEPARAGPRRRPGIAGKDIANPERPARRSPMP